MPITGLRPAAPNPVDEITKEHRIGRMDGLEVIDGENTRLSDPDLIAYSLLLRSPPDGTRAQALEEFESMPTETRRVATAVLVAASQADTWHDAATAIRFAYDLLGTTHGTPNQHRRELRVIPGGK